MLALVEPRTYQVHEANSLLPQVRRLVGQIVELSAQLPELQDQVTEALEGNGLSRMDFRFESGGAMVIMNTLAGKVGALAKPAHV